MGDGGENMELATTQAPDKILESVILHGDISALSPLERVQYYKAVCESVGLNPLTQPLAYIQLSGKSVLYAKKDATDQLRKVHGVSVSASRTERIDDVFLVVVQVCDVNGRQDMGTGAVNIKGLQGDALANALMKAETKAKRRATLSICGLGLLDETELETISELRAPVVASEKGAIETLTQLPTESGTGRHQSIKTDAGEYPFGLPEDVPEAQLNPDTVGGEEMEAALDWHLAEDELEQPVDYEQRVSAMAVQNYAKKIDLAQSFKEATQIKIESQADPRLDGPGHNAIERHYWAVKEERGWKTQKEKNGRGEPRR